MDARDAASDGKASSDDSAESAQSGTDTCGGFVAEVSDSLHHGRVIDGAFHVCFAPWERVWLTEGQVFARQQFASLFRLPIAVEGYVTGNTAAGRESISGWPQA